MEKTITYKNGFELAVKVMYGEYFGLPLMQLHARTVETSEIEELASAIELLEPFHLFCAKKVADALRKMYNEGLIMTASFGREDSPVLYVSVPYWTTQRKEGLDKGARRFTPEERKAMTMRVFEILLEVEPDELGPYHKNIRAWWTCWK